MGSLHADSNDSPSVYRQGVERRSPARWFVLGFCLALCGIALSLWLSRLWSEREQELAQAQFNRDAKERIEALQQILAARLATVSTTAAFFRGSEGYDRKRFATLAKQILEKQPGIQLLAWAPRIPGNKRPAHEQALRTEGFPKYAIGQHGGPGRMTVASERDDYYPVLFFEPAHDNQVLLGYDLGSEPAFRAAFHEGVAGRPTVINSSLGYGREGDRSLLCVIGRPAANRRRRRQVSRTRPRPTVSWWAFSASASSSKKPSICLLRSASTSTSPSPRKREKARRFTRGCLLPMGRRQGKPARTSVSPARSRWATRCGP